MSDIGGPAEHAAGVATGLAAGRQPGGDGAPPGEENQDPDPDNAPGPAVDNAKPPQVTKVSQAKLNNVKNLIVLHFRELENASSDAAAVQRLEVGLDDNVVAIAQRDLLKWYFDYLVAQGAITTREEGVKEIVLAEKIVAHLIRKEGILLVVDTPAQRDAEEARDYAKRVQLERLLALNPNFSQD